MLLIVRTGLEFSTLEALDKCYLRLTWEVYYKDNRKYFYLLMPHSGNHINDSHMLQDPDYSLFSFYSSSQLSRYLLSQVQFTTLSAPCVIKYKHSWNYSCHTCERTFSCVHFMFLSFTCPNTLAEAQLLLWSWYYIQPCAPVTSAETFNSAAFSAPLDKGTPPFQVSIFQMLSMKDGFTRLLSISGVLHLKRPLHHIASEAHELHHRWDLGVESYHPPN